MNWDAWLGELVNGMKVWDVVLVYGACVVVLTGLWWWAIKRGKQQ